MALTFAQTKALYADGTRPETLKCIATPHERRCDSDLEDNQLLNLRDLLQDTSEPMQLEQVRYIIDCLLCTSHQYKKYNHKNKVQKVWQREFPHLDFKTRRSQSPYSLYSGQSTPRRASMRSNSQSPNPTITTPGSSSTVDLVTSLSPPPQPNFHSRTVSEPILPANGRLVTGSDTSPAVYVNHSVFDDAQSAPLSPLATRGRQSDLESARQAGSLDFNHADQVPFEQAPCLNHEPDSESGTPREEEQQELEAPDDQIHPEDPAPQQEHNLRSGRFEHGEASAWAPWTIRKASLQLIREPLLNPRATGYIYAAQVENINRTIVKIGKTYQKPKTRIEQIAKEHQQEFNTGSMWWSRPISALQLERLERLVHSDLAYFQRNWLVATDNSHKTHHEYFEVDLATAAKTVDVWIDIIQKVNLKPGTAPDERLFQSLYSDPELSVSMSEGLGVREAWKKRNEDHSRRINLWKNHLVEHRSTRRRVYKLAWWTGSFVALWLLLDMSPRTWYTLLSFAIPSFMWDSITSA
jgi:hypothetical protein